MSIDTLRGYEADYFIPTVREVLDPLLAEHGFTYAGDHRAVTAYWVSGRQFFRAGYLMETKPRYELLFGVGVSSESPLEVKSSANSIGIWRLLPPDVAPQIANWRFDSRETLRRELVTAWDEAIKPFVAPLWDDDEDRLSALIAEHEDELTDADERLMHDRLLRYARAQFSAGRFAESSHAYAEMRDDLLTAADRKRAEIARRRGATSGT